MDIQNYKCLSCGAPLVFDDKTQQLVCNSCDNKYTIEQFEDFDQFNSDENVEREITWNAPDISKYQKIETESKTFSCPSCGAEIVGDVNTVATSCPYCDNPAVVAENVSGFLKPDFVIPFKKNKNDAKEALKNFYKYKFLVPKAFKNEDRIDKVQGMYVPFWLFDCDGDAQITYSATKVHKWRDSNYRYTKTQFYAVFRAGSISFTKIPVDATSKLDDSFMDALEPFDYSEFMDYDSAYMAGFLADKYDIAAQECMPRAKVRITNSIKEEFLKTVKGYTTVVQKNSNINMKGGKVYYGLLPVWILTTKYKEKTYNFMMNGQTGKVVGQLPLSFKRTLAFWLATSVVVFTILNVLPMLFA